MSKPRASRVRTSIKELVPHFQHVEISNSAIVELADDFSEEDLQAETWDFPCFLDETTPTQDLLDYYVLGNALNFAFRDFETGERFATRYDGITWDGAFGMWAALTEAYSNDIPILDGEYLTEITADDVHELFTPSNGVPIPLAEKRAAILQSIGRKLEEKYDGRFHNLFTDSTHNLYSGEGGFVPTLTNEFPSFADWATVERNSQRDTVYFDKRAQLAAAMLHSRPDVDIMFSDTDRFTLFADYNLPNILRHYDVLEYDDELAARIDNGVPLEASSREEVEVRAATIEAGDRLLYELNLRDYAVTGADLDAALFSRRDDVSTPVHKAKTTAY